MEEYIERYLRNGRDIPKSEFDELFQKDLEEDNKTASWKWTISNAYGELFEGKDIELNGHLYQYKQDISFDSAKELIEYLIGWGEWDRILDAIQSLSEKELSVIVPKIDKVSVNNEKFIIEDWRTD